MHVFAQWQETRVLYMFSSCTVGFLQVLSLYIFQYLTNVLHSELLKLFPPLSSAFLELRRKESVVRSRENYCEANPTSADTDFKFSDNFNIHIHSSRLGHILT